MHVLMVVCAWGRCRQEMDAQEAAAEGLERALNEARARAGAAEQRAAHAAAQLKVRLGGPSHSMSLAGSFSAGPP
jgi:hypothetical protein